MKQHLCLIIVLCFLLLFVAGSTLLIGISLKHPTILAQTLHENALALDQGVAVAPYNYSYYNRSADSHLCKQNPSSTHCNGILPFIPHTFTDRSYGSGACYDKQSTIVNEQLIKDNKNKVIGTFQLWYMESCGSYTTHVIYTPTDTPQNNSMDITTNQFNNDPNALLLSDNNPFPNLGFGEYTQGSPQFGSSQSTGVVKGSNELWSPLLYSPTIPVQATAFVGHNGNPHDDLQAQTISTQFYIAGKREAGH